MIWQPNDPPYHVYIKYSNSHCTCVKSGKKYQSNYKVSEAKRVGYLIAPEELAQWKE